VQFNPFCPAGSTLLSFPAPVCGPPDKTPFVSLTCVVLEDQRYARDLLVLRYRHCYVSQGTHASALPRQVRRVPGVILDSGFEDYRGGLPRRAVSLVLEWAFQHRDDLMINREKAQRLETLDHVEPLE